MQDSRRWVVISLIIGGGVVWGALFLLMRQVNVEYNLSSMVPFGHIVLNAIPIAIAAGVFLWIYRSNQKMQFCDEVVGELGKVTWPTRKDIVASTIVVIITILIIAAILGIYDAICNWGIQKII